jgi:hypothetical protein
MFTLILDYLVNGRIKLNNLICSDMEQRQAVKEVG